MVTRGPGATHAATGVHTAMQDSTPLVLLVGQVPREHRGREAFQEIDYEQMFGRVAKWVYEIDRPSASPRSSRARSQRPSRAGPARSCSSLPEDMLSAHDRRGRRRAGAARGRRAGAADLARMRELLAARRAPARDRRRQRLDARELSATSARS